MEDKVIAVLQDQAARGQVLKHSETEARELFPGLVVASLGAQRKEKPGGEVTARVLFDGTNGIFFKRTKVRDQERSPIAADVKRAMRERAALVNARTDGRRVRSAPANPHSPKVIGDTWGAGSKPEELPSVLHPPHLLVPCGTALGRLSQCMVGQFATTWHLLVADDFHLEAGENAIDRYSLLSSRAGVPLSWGKTAGGDVI